MKQNKKISRREFLTAASSLAAIGLLASCAPMAPVPAQAPADEAPQSSAPAEPAEGVNLHVAIMSAHGMSDSGEEVVKQFNELFAPNQAELTAIGFDTLLDKMLQDFTTGANSFDVYSVGYHWIGTVGNYLLDLGELRDANPDIVDENYDYDDFPKILWDTYATWQGKNIGLPFVDGTLTLFYRTDLFENEEYMAQFKDKYGYDLKMPQDGDDWRLTHQQLRDYAEFFHSGVKWRQEGEDQYGITIPAKVGDPLLSVYCTIFGDYRRSPAGIEAFGEVDPDWGDYFTKDHQVAYSPELSDLGLQALQVYTDIGQFSPNPANLDWITSSEPFRAGISAMFAGWGGYWPSLVAPDSPIVDKVHVTMLPMPHLGGWNVAINKDSQNPRQAYQYIQHLTNKENTKLLYEQFTETPTRLSTMTDPELKAKNVDLWVMAPSLELCSTRPKIPVLPQMEQAMGSILGQVWTGDLEPEEALKQNAEEWTKIIQNAGLI